MTWKDNTFVCDLCDTVYDISKAKDEYGGPAGPEMPHGWYFIIIGHKFYHYHAPYDWDILLHFCSMTCIASWMGQTQDYNVIDAHSKTAKAESERV